MDVTTSELTFDNIPDDGRGVAMLNGQPWRKVLWEYGDIRRLERDVTAGSAQITQSRSTGKIWLRLAAPEAFQRATIEKSLTFDNLLAALEVAEAFQWDVRELAGAKWYETGVGSWTTVLGDGDVATVIKYEDGTFGMKRQIRPRDGESYEISASRYKSAESDHSVRSFNEAAAIAITLPAYLTVLGAK